MGAANGSVGDSDLQVIQLVLVYGTLKRGQCNHHRLAGSACLGTARLRGLALYDLGPFPMAIPCPDSDAVLQGEVYAVGDDQLLALDRFEGVPRLYERQRHRLDGGRSVWVYVGRPMQVRNVRRIPSGQWPGPP